MAAVADRRPYFVELVVLVVLVGVVVVVVVVMVVAAVLVLVLVLVLGVLVRLLPHPSDGRGARAIPVTTCTSQLLVRKSQSRLWMPLPASWPTAERKARLSRHCWTSPACRQPTARSEDHRGTAVAGAPATAPAMPPTTTRTTAATTTTAETVTGTATTTSMTWTTMPTGKQCPPSLWRQHPVAMAT
jgi:hypothetical protein